MPTTTGTKGAIKNPKTVVVPRFISIPNAYSHNVASNWR